jgi:hypothetical protein
MPLSQKKLAWQNKINVFVLANSSSLALCYIIVSGFGISLLFGTIAALKIGDPEKNGPAILTTTLVLLMAMASNYLICYCGHSVEIQVHILYAQAKNII